MQTKGVGEVLRYSTLRRKERTNGIVGTESFYEMDNQKKTPLTSRGLSLVQEPRRLVWIDNSLEIRGKDDVTNDAPVQGRRLGKLKTKPNKII